jgi:hypothetical protein
MSQRGWLTKEARKRAGKVWVYHYYYYRTRETDGHRVENTVAVGALSSLLRKTYGQKWSIVALTATTTWA